MIQDSTAFHNIEEMYWNIQSALLKLDDLYQRTPGSGFRFGQLFMNIMNLRNPWPEVYYERDKAKAWTMIRQWLEDNQCPDRLERAIETELLRRKNFLNKL